jgi:hypothetical protein
MAVGDVKAVKPRKLGGIPDFSKIQVDVKPADRPPASPATPDVYLPSPEAPADATGNPATRQPKAAPAAPAPGEPTPEQMKLFAKIGATIGAAVGGLLNYGFYRKAASLIAAGKPVGAALGKVAPMIGAAFGTWGLVKKVTVDWNQKDNHNKWDDCIRIAGDALQIAGGIAALVPGIGLLPGLAMQLASVGVNWVGEMFNDSVTPPSNPIGDLFGLDRDKEQPKAEGGK